MEHEHQSHQEPRLGHEDIPQGCAVESPDNRVGIPDAFQRLWTPHRMVYIGGESKPADSTPGQCPFCASPQRGDDEQALIVYRGDLVYAIMNLYPYNPGHLLVLPYRHVADLTELTTEERDELFDVSAQAMRVLRAVSHPDGFNLGMNQGDVAGAGIAAHLHHHVVPRWKGDANFLPIVGQTKAVPQLLSEARTALAQAWPIHAHDGEQGETC